MIITCLVICTNEEQIYTVNIQSLFFRAKKRSKPVCQKIVSLSLKKPAKEAWREKKRERRNEKMKRWELWTKKEWAWEGGGATKARIKRKRKDGKRNVRKGKTKESDLTRYNVGKFCLDIEMGPPRAQWNILHLPSNGGPWFESLAHQQRFFHL